MERTLEPEGREKGYKMLSSGHDARTHCRHARTAAVTACTGPAQECACQPSAMDLGGASGALPLPAAPLAIDGFLVREKPLPSVSPPGSEGQLQTCGHRDRPG